MFHDQDSWLGQQMGNQSLNQDFNLQSSTGQGGTDFAYNTAQQLWDKGDPMAQRLLRENMMDSTPSMNTMLGMQQATGGSSAIGRMMNLQGQNRAQNTMAQGLMKMRGQDISNSLRFNQQGMGGQQWTQGMDWQQQLENDRRQGDQFQSGMNIVGGAMFGAGGLGGTGFMQGGGISGASWMPDWMSNWKSTPQADQSPYNVNINYGQGGG